MILSSHFLVLVSPVFSPPPSSYWLHSTAFSSCTRTTACTKRDAIASTCPMLLCTALRIVFDPPSRSMRRRHGIPDNDHRPFNVAYAAAKRAQKEREAKEKGISIRSSSSSSVVGSQVAEQPVAATTGQATRQRQRTGAPLSCVYAPVPVLTSCPTCAAPSAQPLQSGDTEEIPQSRSGYLESRRTSGQTVTASESEYYVYVSSYIFSRTSAYEPYV